MHNKKTDNLNSFPDNDPYLKPFEKIIKKRLAHFHDTERMLTKGEMSLTDFAAGHEYFGLHFFGDHWVFREWAPNATAIYIIGEMTQWKEEERFALKKTGTHGEWEIRLPWKTLKHGSIYRLRIHWDGCGEEGWGDRIPAYARRVVQDPETKIFNAQVWMPDSPYKWKFSDSLPAPNPLYIYEAHVGMAQEEEKIGSYREFARLVIPRIVSAGYNTLQLMAIPEHPYYGSFGYQVSSFFAASSRFGTPDDLKELIDTAHKAGLFVIMDLVHSHAVSNEVEGLSRFDGTLYQYFHEDHRGLHEAWSSRCFDYKKYQVLHFLLSNCRFWIDEYHIDGFRFDGVTSMLYLHHGIGTAFTSYDNYFDDSVDEDAITYLALANSLIHSVKPEAITIAEDISGMPGLCVPLENGGTGFDYRFAMGISDFWIKLTKDIIDEEWPMGYLWHELNNRRDDEKTISYSESHDQALVGDKTLMFRLIGEEMYDHMSIDDDNIIVDRGIALHKMIRFITLSTSGNGYLNFMGNEFGHPEWIDFPREGNMWSCRYARRQWHLVDDKNLKYHFLSEFDHDMIAFIDSWQVLKSQWPQLLYLNENDKVVAFKRQELVFVFNFHPVSSYVDYRFEIMPGEYIMVFNSDGKEYGGHGRLSDGQKHPSIPYINSGLKKHQISLYLPTRTALVFAPAYLKSAKLLAIPDRNEFR